MEFMRKMSLRIRTALRWLWRPWVLTAFGLLAAALLLAGALLLPRFLFAREPKKNELYQHVQVTTTNLRAPLDGLVFKVRGVARNARDGGFHWGDGRGGAIDELKPVSALDGLTSCAAWMDAANIYLGVDSPDPRAAVPFSFWGTRVFDHATRQPLGGDSDGPRSYGWKNISRDAVQVRGLGCELPEAVDLFLYVTTYPTSSTRLRLAARPGAQVTHGGGVLRVASLESTGLNEDTRARFETKGWSVDFIEITALDRNGALLAGNSLDYNHHAIATSSSLTFNTPLDDIAAFELGRGGRLHSILFENIRLPGAGARQFTKPPSAKVKVDGRENSAILPELEPLHVKMHALHGDGSISCGEGGLGGIFVERTSIQKQDKISSFILFCDGMHFFRSMGLTALYDRAGVPINPSLYRWRMGMNGTRFSLRVFEVDLPLEQIGSAEFGFLPPGK